MGLKSKLKKVVSHHFSSNFFFVKTCLSTYFSMALVKPESQVSGIPNLSLLLFLLSLSWKRRLGESPGRENWEWWVTRIDGNVFIIFIPWFRVSISSFRWFIGIGICTLYLKGGKTSIFFNIDFQGRRNEFWTAGARTNTPEPKNAEFGLL